MLENIKPYKNSDLSKKEQVTQMFNNISKNYDGLNRIISFGTDVKWRKKVVKIASEKKPKQILDVATGTGDLAIVLTKTKAEKVVGLDISKGMLAIGKKKIAKANLADKIDMIVGDSENIPYQNDTFDVVTISFGIRNFTNLQESLQEIKRVLKPNGLLIILETSNPTKFPFKQGYKIYCNYIMPTIGKLFSKDKTAYTYLSESANSFPFGKAFNNILQKNGFNNIKNQIVTLGVATIYTATK